MIAGPNGAGKTTFAEEFLPNEAACREFVNADLIAAGLSPFCPEKVAFAAGRLMLRRIDELVAAGACFSIETTLSTRSWARQVPRWQSAGYRLTLHFLSLPDSDFAIRRVERRVLQGGHNIPPDVIRRRFVRGLDNFQKVYRGLVDECFIYDGCRQPPLLLDAGDGGGGRLMEDSPPYRTEDARPLPDCRHLENPEVRGALAALARGAANAVARDRAAGLQPVVVESGEIEGDDPGMRVGKDGAETRPRRV